MAPTGLRNDKFLYLGLIRMITGNPRGRQYMRIKQIVIYASFSTPIILLIAGLLYGIVSYTVKTIEVRPKIPLSITLEEPSYVCTKPVYDVF